VELVRKNGDGSKLSRIVSEAEKILREKSGHRKLVFETARPMTAEMRHSLLHMVHKTDTVEEKVSPSLIAGVRVTQNDELEWDGSMAKKLQKIFPY
jgi:F0F1-type ATP synthase delta subunit